ncbi:hypothetical protein EB796_004033 [Bugula neritina]|uniref:Uncharacterized protein n=1 Tax=Bugula neritina TaxID=10212 RepID=A0A7J7KIC3_BUGNE|nr:hypothetical protein EB796_004033 [Bugula neritina]
MATHWLHVFAAVLLMVAVQSNQSETTSLKEYLRNNTGIHSHLLEVHRFIEKSFEFYLVYEGSSQIKDRCELKGNDCANISAAPKDVAAETLASIHRHFSCCMIVNSALYAETQLFHRTNELVICEIGGIPEVCSEGPVIKGLPDCNRYPCLDAIETTICFLARVKSYYECMLFGQEEV